MPLVLDRRSRYAAAIAGVLLAFVLLVALMPWNWLRGPVARYASARFDRPVAIAGDLRVHWGRLVRVEADGVSVGNVAWASEQPMLETARIILWFEWPSLLAASPSRVRLVDPKADLQRNAQGEDNWHVGHGDAVPTNMGNIAIERGVARYRDAIAEVDVTLDLNTDDATADRGSLQFSGKGTLHGESITVSGHSEGLAELQNIDDAYSLALNVKGGATSIQFDGTVVPSDVQNLRGTLRLAGPDLSKLYPLVPAPLPWSPPYNLNGSIAHQNHIWRYTGVSGTVGDSDLAGDIAIDVSRKRSLVTADLASKRFDYKDLGGFVGLPPGEPTKRARTPEQRAHVAARAATNRVLPDKPFELEKLRQHDVELTFRGRSVRWERVPLDNLVAKVSLKDGVLRFAPLDFGIADGHVVASIVLDATKDVPHADADVTVRNVELKRIFPQLASPQGTAGRFGGRARFKTQGNTVSQMMAAADGDAAIIMRGGEASTLTLVLTNLDLARAAELTLRGDQTAGIRCAVMALRSQHGVVTPDLFVVDTTAVLITGEGSVDFGDERYDALLRAKSKQPSLLALRGPIVIDGTFKSPSVHPAVGPVAMRVGAAIGLGAIAPPLALLPLIDFGGAPDVDCRSLMQDARISAGVAPANPPAAVASRPAARASN